jgi:hypothetical protein
LFRWCEAYWQQKGALPAIYEICYVVLLFYTIKLWSSV